jgi:hypothetical protein
MNNGFIIKKASKRAKKLRLLLSASSGSGKTYGALQIAYGLCGDWSKICVIDTERSSASLYADMGEYNTLDLQAPYSPERFIEAIKEVENAGMEVIIIDSITHEWEGSGGMLEIHGAMSGDSFQNWRKCTPQHNKFVNAILNSTCHQICTVRRKEDYAMVVGSSGKMQVQKMGLKEQTRDGFSYEMDCVFEVTNDSHLTVSTKDRTGVFMKGSAIQDPFLITIDTGKKILEWCNQGRSELDDALEQVRNCNDKNKLNDIFLSYTTLKENEDFIGACKLKKEELNKN